MKAAEELVGLIRGISQQPGNQPRLSEVPGAQTGTRVVVSEPGYIQGDTNIGV